MTNDWIVVDVKVITEGCTGRVGLYKEQINTIPSSGEIGQIFSSNDGNDEDTRWFLSFFSEMHV
jgi:hypothetical protein